MSVFHYDPTIYRETDAQVVLPVFFSFFKPHVIVDIGCGRGTWLKEAVKLGVKEIIGIDEGPFHPETSVLHQQQYMQADLSIPLSASIRADCCFCLEVAEHLPEKHANTLLDTLTGIADMVLFSAAIPGQGGDGHLNEQWPAYWQLKFAERGFNAYDIIRPVIWNHPEIHFWYQQNIMVYAKENGQLKDIPATGTVTAMVHPQLYLNKCNELTLAVEQYKKIVWNPSPANGFRLFAKSLLQWVKR